MGATVQVRLGDRGVVVHELGAVDHLEDARRHVEKGVAVRMPAFQQEDAVPAIGHQPGGGDTARRAAADDDVIEFLARHRGLPPLVW